MQYAEVSVNSPIAQRRTFSYGIPADLSINIGQAVWVPFGDKILQGVVLELTTYPSVEETREIEGVINPIPLLSPVQVSLARWLSNFYLAPLFESVALMLPPGFERRVITFIESHLDISELPVHLSTQQSEILELVRQKGKIQLKTLEKTFGSKCVQKAIPFLIHHHLVVKSYEMGSLKVKPKIVPYLHLKVKAEEAQNALNNSSKRNRKQADLLQLLIDSPHVVAQSEAKKRWAAPAKLSKP